VTAVDYYQQALQLDSGYAEALAKSAEASLRLARYSLRPETEKWWARAEEEALQALELDDGNAFCHLTWALVQQKKHDDIDSAEESFKRALELDPRVAETHLCYGGFLCGRGRLDEAYTALKKAQELDPLGYRTNEHLVRFHLVRGEFDQALEHSRRILEYHPALVYGPMWLAATYLHLGEYEKVLPLLEEVVPVVVEWYHLPAILIAWSHMYQGELDEASKIAERVLSSHPKNGWGNEFAAALALWKGDYKKALRHYELVRSSPLFFFIWRAPLAHHHARMGYAVWKLGDRAEAEKLFAESERICEARIKEGDQRYGFREVLAMIYAIRGNREEALRWFEEAIEAGWSWHNVALNDPVWENLNENPRFLEMIAKVRARVDKQRSLVAEMEKEWKQ
jgi:Tfp pilus assembly protein PilF